MFTYCDKLNLKPKPQPKLNSLPNITISVHKILSESKSILETNKLRKILKRELPRSNLIIKQKLPKRLRKQILFLCTQIVPQYAIIKLSQYIQTHYDLQIKGSDHKYQVTIEHNTISIEMCGDVCDVDGCQITQHQHLCHKIEIKFDKKIQNAVMVTKIS